MQVVANKKDKTNDTPKVGRPPATDPKVHALNARLPSALAAALKAYMKTRRPRPTTTAVALLALEEFLQREGFWPPA
jgi:hypothetical protein